LPGLELATRPLDVAKLLATVFTAFVMVYLKVYVPHQNLVARNALGNLTSEEQADFDTGGIYKPVLVLLVSYIIKLVLKWRTNRVTYANRLTKSLYDKFMDSGDGVRSYLIDAQHQQDYKEALLAYYFVWQRRAETIEELDDECEMFLRRHGDEVNFEVPDAVEKLANDGLMYVHGALEPKSRVTALTLRRAIKKLDDIWMFLLEDKDKECPFCMLINEGRGGSTKTLENSAESSSGDYDNDDDDSTDDGADF
jgi:hypothetical protein